MKTSSIVRLATALILAALGSVSADPQRAPASQAPEPTTPSVAAPAHPEGEGRLLVDVKPWARVTIDGESVGNSPLERIPLAAGTHHVVLEHPRYRSLQREVTITPGQTARLSVDLAVSADPQRAPATPRPAPTPRPAASPAAEEGAASPAPAEKRAEKKAEREEPYVQLSNVRIDLTLTDRRGSEAPVVKTATMTLAHRDSGMLRATAEVPQPTGTFGPPTRFYQLNLDARTVIQDPTHVHLNLTVEYQPQPASGSPSPGFQLKGVTGTVVESGRSIVVAEASDPISDRRVTLEVKATILR